MFYKALLERPYNVKAQSDTKSSFSESLNLFHLRLQNKKVHECLKENKQKKHDLSKSMVKP
jgi:hypothetical protein